MATTYTKPHLTVPEQVQLLSSRGMTIPDRSSAEHWLGVVGYYRLSGYWYPYRVRQPGSSDRADQFTPGTSLDQVVALYDFDRRLKLLVVDALERVEIAMRFRVGYALGRRGAYAHLSPTNLDGAFTRSRPGRNSTYDTWLRKTGAAQASPHEDFVEHFRTKYYGRLPVWVVTEILDFGSLSFLYAGLKRPDRDEIAHELGVSDMAGAGDGAALRNWMQVLNYLRNVGAHHSRLWNRNMTVQLTAAPLRHNPALRHLTTGPDAGRFRVFGALCVVNFLLDQVSPGHRWAQRVRRLVETGLPPSGRSPSEMGMPEGWASLPMWKPSPCPRAG